MTRLVALLVLATVVVAGCSRDPGNSRRSMDSAITGNLPPCATVWVEGKSLPLSYRACEEEGETQGASLYPCLDGGTLAIYRERFYARLGGPIVAVDGEMIDDPAYAEFWHECVG